MNFRPLILCAAVTLLATSLDADTFTVTNTGDTGGGSLRQAIEDANNHSGMDTIFFNIPGSDLNCNATTHVCTITPTTGLLITSPVTLDGYTQPGSSANAFPAGDNAVLRIEINGARFGNSGNGLSLLTGSSGSTIRGLVIDNGWSAAILVQADSIAVEGCFLGTDPTGTIARGNTQGVAADQSPNQGMRIGGTSPAARNLISGNSVGVFTRAGANHLVQGNFIGTNAAGTAALANTIAIDVRSADTLVGGPSVAARNVIAGDGHTDGINVGEDSATRTVIQGNFIGTDVTGANALGFSNAILLNVNSSHTQVGGPATSPGAPPGNVIAGSFTGIFVEQGVSNNLIQGNLIGTDATGTKALGNSLDGINLQGTFNIIGGSNVMARNIISANGRHGISLGVENAPVHDNFLVGNFIGTDISGAVLLGNGQDGVFVTDCFNNTIGGLGANAGNVIAGSGGNGIAIAGSQTVGVSVMGNSIFLNSGLGIDLGLDGVTQNDLGDVDTGANNLQNFPVLTSVNNSGGNTAISGALNGAPNAIYRIEFFANDTIDPSGYGEGQSFLGFTSAPTDSSGNAAFNVSFPQIAGKPRVTATATDQNGNTSEFSAAIGQLLNISTRLRVLTGDNVLIGGFIITGTDAKKVIVRGKGPSLASQGVPGALADPTLELHDGTGTIIASNDNWRDTQQSEIQATGIPPGNDLESAIVATLRANNSGYTAVLRGKNNTTGVGLVEVYDLDQAANSKLANISTRGFVDTGDNVMIGGLIAGNGAAKVIVRAIGPSLASQGVPGALQDPTLELHDGSGATIASNDNWKDTQQSEIEATTVPPTDNRESAIVTALSPGLYTAIVRGKNNSTGVALVEVYALN